MKWSPPGSSASASDEPCSTAGSGRRGTVVRRTSVSNPAWSRRAEPMADRADSPERDGRGASVRLHVLEQLEVGAPGALQGRPESRIRAHEKLSGERKRAALRAVSRLHAAYFQYAACTASSRCCVAQAPAATRPASASRPARTRAGSDRATTAVVGSVELEQELGHRRIHHKLSAAGDLDRKRGEKTPRSQSGPALRSRSRSEYRQDRRKPGRTRPSATTPLRMGKRHKDRRRQRKRCEKAAEAGPSQLLPS